MWSTTAQDRLGRAAPGRGRAAPGRAGPPLRRGGPGRRCRAALGLGTEFTAGIVDQVEVDLLEAALRALPAAGRRLALSGQAAAMARRLGDPATLAAVQYDRHLAIWGSPEAEVAGERLAIATEVVRLAEAIGDREMALRGRGLRRSDLLEQGDIAGFEADLAASEETARQVRQLHYRWQLPLARPRPPCWPAASARPRR